MKKPPSYWRRQVRRGKIRADDPRVIGTAAPLPGPSIDERIAHLPRPTAPARHR